jgi:hypothetical protein
MQKPPKLTASIEVYFTPEEKEKIVEYMLKNSYYVSLSTFIRSILLEKFKIK